MLKLAAQEGNHGVEFLLFSYECLCTTNFSIWMSVTRFLETWSFILCISFMTVNDMTSFYETWSIPCISFVTVNDIVVINLMTILKTLWHIKIWRPTLMWNCSNDNCEWHFMNDIMNVNYEWLGMAIMNDIVHKSYESRILRMILRMITVVPQGPRISFQYNARPASRTLLVTLLNSPPATFTWFLLHH